MMERGLTATWENVACHSPAILSCIFHLPTYHHILISRYVLPKIPFGKSCLSPAMFAYLLGKVCRFAWFFSSFP
jgi:hypothetical protein